MAVGKQILIIFAIVGLALLYQQYKYLTTPASRPKIDENQYWGPGSGKNYKENKAITPFQIKTAPEIINQLSTQLKGDIKYQTPLDNVAFEYGFNNAELKNVVAYWRDTYIPKWNEREQYLNKFPQYKTQIQGLNIHFIHVKPKNTGGKKVLPLLLLHGWPGSVREFYEIIPLLTQSNSKSDYVFEVIVPSLVGYGWSDPATKVGFGPVQMATVMNNLMHRVGHEKYYVQGGDWGSIIGARLAALYPQNVLGYHSNMIVTNFNVYTMFKRYLVAAFPNFFLEKEQVDFYKPFGQYFSYMMEESGYFHIQSTKPDTIGAALLNNPVGLAAYILEKFSSWTNYNFKNLPDGGITKRYSLDSLLDNVMIYYLTNSITTSQRFYAEAWSLSQLALGADQMHIHVPVGAARFLHDLSHTHDWAAADIYKNLIHSTYHADGGHFAALELPKVLYEDFIEFIKKAENLKIVKSEKNSKK